MVIFKKNKVGKKVQIYKTVKVYPKGFGAKIKKFRNS